MGAVSGVAGAVSRSATVETSLGELWMSKFSSGTRRRGEEVVPRISPGLSPRNPESGIFYRPEERKHFAASDQVMAGKGRGAIKAN